MMAFGNHCIQCGADIGIGITAAHGPDRSGNPFGGIAGTDTDMVAVRAFIFSRQRYQSLQRLSPLPAMMFRHQWRL